MGLENAVKLKRDRLFLIREEVRDEKSYQREAKTYSKKKGFQRISYNRKKAQRQAVMLIYQG